MQLSVETTNHLIYVKSEARGSLQDVISFPEPSPSDHARRRRDLPAANEFRELGLGREKECGDPAGRKCLVHARRDEREGSLPPHAVGRRFPSIDGVEYQRPWNAGIMSRIVSSRRKRQPCNDSYLRCCRVGLSCLSGLDTDLFDARFRRFPSRSMINLILFGSIENCLATAATSRTRSCASNTLASW